MNPIYNKPSEATPGDAEWPERPAVVVVVVIVAEEEEVD